MLAVALAATLVLWLAPATPAKRTFIRRLPVMLVVAWALSWLFATDNPNMGLSLTHNRGFESIDSVGSGRLAIWSDAFHATLASPLWGWVLMATCSSPARQTRRRTHTTSCSRR